MPVSEPTAEREVLTYDSFGLAVRELCQTIVDDEGEPDVDLAVARRALASAMGLAHARDVKDLVMVNVELDTGIGTRLEAPVVLAPVPSVGVPIGGSTSRGRGRVQSRRRP